MKSYSILVVEDEATLGVTMQKGLIESGFEVDLVTSAQSAISRLKTKKFDLVISDIIMPQMTGLELIQQTVSQGNITPFLFLSALNSTEDKIIGLELGAEDYITKPFEFRELILRIRVILKRKKEDSFSTVVTCDDLEVNLYKKKVTRNGIDIQLTQREYDLLVYFLNNQNRIISKKELTEKVWGLNFDTGTNVIEVYINYLRNKINIQSERKLIETIHGQGYRLNN